MEDAQLGLRLPVLSFGLMVWFCNTYHCIIKPVERKKLSSIKTLMKNWINKPSLNQNNNNKKKKPSNFKAIT